MIVSKVGDHLPWPKRAIVNFVVKHVQRRVRPSHVPNAIAYRDALARGARLPFRRPDLRGADVAFLQYTGGTTGRAKGAMLTHRNLVANTLQCAAWVAPFYDEKGGVALTPLPIYHVYSLTANVLCFMEVGAHNVLITDPRDVHALVKLLRRTRVAYMTAVNTLFNALLNTPGFAGLDFSALRVCMGGGMAVQREVAQRWQHVTGIPIAQGYGLTEASPVVSGNPLNLKGFNGSVGVPFPSTEVEICDDTGRALGVGEVGEICVRGPQVMARLLGTPGRNGARDARRRLAAYR